MESPRTSTDLNPRQSQQGDALDPTAARLEMLLAENAEFATKQNSDLSAREAAAEASLKYPVDPRQAFSQLGLLTGAIPTTAIFIKLIVNSNPGNMGSMVLATALVIAASITATAATGFYSGRVVGKIVADLERKPWITMLAALPFVGACWGLLCGAAGGILLFGVGAIVGGAIGGAVGALVLSVFTIIHRLVKDGDSIERNRYLPIALGIVGAVAAFILGL